MSTLSLLGKATHESVISCSSTTATHHRSLPDWQKQQAAVPQLGSPLLSAGTCFEKPLFGSCVTYRCVSGFRSVAETQPGLTSCRRPFLVAFSLSLLEQVCTRLFKPGWHKITALENAGCSLLLKEQWQGFLGEKWYPGSKTTSNIRLSLKRGRYLHLLES